MSLFRFPHLWPAIAGRVPELAPVVDVLDERDRALEDYLATVRGEVGNQVITYATGGVTISYAGSYRTALVPVANLERPVGVDPWAIYVSNPTTTGFTVSIYSGTGAEAGAGGLFRVYWHALPQA